jgi:phytoene dehydrogenase-like protein
MLQYFGLHRNKEFVDFVNEQLLITAQNHCREVNMLFGATALCYTNFGNYYLFGGLIRLVRPLCDYLEQQGADLRLRTKVVRAELAAYGGYTVHTAQGQTLHADRLLWGIPLNNVLECMPHDQQLQRRYRSRQLGGEVLNSAFQLGIGYRQPTSPAVCLHHQIHLPQALPQTGSKSIFLSLSHPLDVARAPRGYGVASVSTHVSQPHQRQHLDKAAATEVVLSELERRQLLPLQHVVYRHSADPAEWERWTARKYGFVGGYPQLMRVKPWQMNDARLDGRGMYLCGDTAYPGQGIPGATLSGIIAHRKMTLDPI